MKFFAIVNQDMEELAQQELKELIKVEAKVVDSVLEFETEKISFVAQHMQSARRLLVAVDRVKDINKLNLVAVINNQHVPVFFVNYTYENSEEYSSVIIKENQKKIRVRSGIVGRENIAESKNN